MVRVTFFALIILCVVCLMLFATTTLTNGGMVLKTFAAHPDVPPSGGLLLWAKTDGTMQTTNSGGTDAGMGGGGGGGAGPIVSAYNAATYADTSNVYPTFTLVSFDSNAFDTSSGAMHSTSANLSQFVAPTSGYYWASCTMMMVSGNTFFGKLRLNGTTDVQASGTGASTGVGFPINRASTYLHMNAGDYLEYLYAFGTTTSDHPTNGTAMNGATFQLLKLF